MVGHLLERILQVDDEESHLDEILNTINIEITKIGIDDNLLRINYNNWGASLTATRFTNHFSSDIDEIINLFKKIAEIAPGSYGLLYLHDDENRNGLDNIFQVLVLSRGTVTWREDTFLSPYIPTVEDEEVFGDNK